MKNQPKVIYLQIDADGETPDDFKPLTNVSWCDDKIHDSDLVYYSQEYVDRARIECFEAGAKIDIFHTGRGTEVDREFETFEDYIKHKEDETNS